MPSKIPTGYFIKLRKILNFFRREQNISPPKTRISRQKPRVKLFPKNHKNIQQVHCLCGQ